MSSGVSSGKREINPNVKPKSRLSKLAWNPPRGRLRRRLREIRFGACSSTREKECYRPNKGFGKGARQWSKTYKLRHNNILRRYNCHSSTIHSISAIGKLILSASNESNNPIEEGNTRRGYFLSQRFFTAIYVREKR